MQKYQSSSSRLNYTFERDYMKFQIIQIFTKQHTIYSSLSAKRVESENQLLLRHIRSHLCPPYTHTRAIGTKTMFPYLQALRTTLCALRLVSAQTRVTSTSNSACSNASKAWSICV